MLQNKKFTVFGFIFCLALPLAAQDVLFGPAPQQSPQPKSRPVVKTQVSGKPAQLKQRVDEYFGEGASAQDAPVAVATVPQEDKSKEKEFEAKIKELEAQNVELKEDKSGLQYKLNDAEAASREQTKDYLEKRRSEGYARMKLLAYYQEELESAKSSDTAAKVFAGISVGLAGISWIGGLILLVEVGRYVGLPVMIGGFLGFFILAMILVFGVMPYTRDKLRQSQVKVDAQEATIKEISAELEESAT